MRTLHKVTEYEGGNIHPHFLYTASKVPFKLIGKVDMTTYGYIKFNGARIQVGRINTEFKTEVEIELCKDSAIIFNSLPTLSIYRVKATPVEDVPEMLTSSEAQMIQLFEKWARVKGLKSIDESIDNTDAIYEDDEYDDIDEYDMNYPLDDISLLSMQNPKINDPDEVEQEKEIIEEENATLDDTQEMSHDDVNAELDEAGRVATE